MTSRDAVALADTHEKQAAKPTVPLITFKKLQYRCQNCGQYKCAGHLPRTISNTMRAK